MKYNVIMQNIVDETDVIKLESTEISNETMQGKFFARIKESFETGKILDVSGIGEHCFEWNGERVLYVPTYKVVGVYTT